MGFSLPSFHQFNNKEKLSKFISQMKRSLTGFFVPLTARLKLLVVEIAFSVVSGFKLIIDAIGEIVALLRYYVKILILKIKKKFHRDKQLALFKQKKKKFRPRLKSFKLPKFLKRKSKTIYPKKGHFLLEFVKFIKKFIQQKYHGFWRRLKNILKPRQRYLPKFMVKLGRWFLYSRHSFLVSFILTIFILGTAWYTYDLVFKDLPSALDLTEKEQIVTTRILDRNGKLLFRIYKDENRTIVPLEQIPQHMINATIAIEDKNFYHHHGFSITGIVRALFKNLQSDNLQGGSTITQQLVKNRLLNNQRTLRRKLREVLLAILVESTYSKDEILEMYLNEVPYGGSTYGVEEAAWKYFNKPARDLSLGESSLLAGLPVAPSVYTPFGSNPEFSQRRQKEVLRRMVEENFISIEEAYKAEQEELSYRTDVIDIRAPHFVMYVRKLLAERYGEDVVQQGGLEVRTTLDLDLQTKAQEIVTQEIEKIERLNIGNGAALVTNPQTGEILAMVGSKDYFDFANDGQVNVTLRPRQPGSSIKPLTYATAFENGKTPWSTIDDSAITYHIPGSKPYSPQNYDGRFHGRVTIRQALANSYNVPAVKTLAGLGVEKLLDKGDEMGISTWTDRSRFGLSLTLGAGEVLMTDMVKVYGAFANGGHRVDLDPFIEIKDYHGDVLYQNTCFKNPAECQQNQVLDPLAAYRITSVLSDNLARVPAFGRFSVLEIPGHEVAVKTGTTNNLRDNWTIGYTTNRLVGVWVGNNDNSSMSYVASGITGASPIWSEIMQSMLDKDNPHKFSYPEGYEQVQICATTGTLPCAGCPSVTTEVFAKGTQPLRACNRAYFVKPTSKPEKKSPQPQIL